MTPPISIKLLSTVLEDDCFEPIWSDAEDLVYSRKPYKETGNRINSHELANLCKVWASELEIGYNVVSGVNTEGKGFALFGMNFKHFSDLPQVTAETEPEAVFGACQLILERQE